MTDSEFHEQAEATLRAIEAAADAASVDIESTRAGNVLTLELDSGARIVVNTQAPMQQIWVAARSGAHHYAWNGSAWHDTRDDTELFAALSRIVSAEGGAPVVLAAR